MNNMRITNGGIAAIFLALVVVTAGCMSGSPGDGSDAEGGSTAADPTTSEPTARDDASASADGSDGATAAVDGELRVLRQGTYRVGEEYRFESRIGDSPDWAENPELVNADYWVRVTGADDDLPVLDVSVTDETGTTELNGTDMAISLQAGYPYTVARLHTSIVYGSFDPTGAKWAAGVDPAFEVGDSWNSPFDDEDQETVFTVTGEETYAGVTCSVVTMGDGDAVSSELCLNPDVGFPLHVVNYDADGKTVLEITMVEYTRN